MGWGTVSFQADWGQKGNLFLSSWLISGADFLPWAFYASFSYPVILSIPPTPKGGTRPNRCPSQGPWPPFYPPKPFAAPAKDRGAALSLRAAYKDVAAAKARGFLLEPS